MLDSALFAEKLAPQGCQMVLYCQTKNPNLGKFWRVLQWKMSVYFMVICHILWTVGIFHGYLVYFSPFGMSQQEKSGNPVAPTLVLIHCPQVAHDGMASNFVARHKNPFMCKRTFTEAIFAYKKFQTLKT
jgi:hypothetical protein